ncbi:MAG: methyltransferase domain-containing protein [Alphaproteobacteria bacterium]
MSQFENYGKMAALGVDDVYQNGRYKVQEGAQAEVPDDVMGKLRIHPDDSFLDIGCGLGLNLFPVAKIVAHAAGCDHPNVIEKIENKEESAGIAYHKGDFNALNFDRKYTKILAYSVLHTMPNEAALYGFIDRAISLLEPNGILLLGDIANTDKKKRFTGSARGLAFQKQWEQEFGAEKFDEASADWGLEHGNAVVIDDDFLLRIIKHIRQAGMHAYTLDQPQSLPFGNTREDIVIIGPEYEDR